MAPRRRASSLARLVGARTATASPEFIAVVVDRLAELRKLLAVANGQGAAMPTYTVSVILENVELTDDVLDTLFLHLPDSVPSAVNGVVKVTVPVDASDDQTAAFDVIDQLHAALPDATIARLDQDLVSISDVAERTGRTRESVRLLVDGKRGPGEFPAPVGTVGDAIRVWPWSAVLTWFREMLGDDLGQLGVHPETAALVDACLYGKVRRRARSAPGPLGSA